MTQKAALSGTPTGEARLVLPLDAVDRASLSLVGGKAANLGELVRAGMPAPLGFAVTTAAYELVAREAGMEPVLDALAETPPGDGPRLASLAAQARDLLLSAPVPDGVRDELSAAYRALGEGAPVAVRSSATAEDLPGASFAGQQDTFLNVVGDAAVLEAARRCWASLWTERAVGYRAGRGIAPRDVRLAVVVQKMVDAEVAGVLFTANPVTGRRRQAVIDSSRGLGEAVVSGAVNPDHFVVETSTGGIVERRIGDKGLEIRPERDGGTRRVEVAGGAEPSLTDAQVRALAELGSRVEAHYGSPQDTEWAIDERGKLWLLQSRPITTLFPLPADAPATDDHPRAYFSVNVAQGVYRPLTPMGLQAFRLVASGAATLFGHAPGDPLGGPRPLKSAAGRLFFDVTPLLRNPVGRPLLSLAARNMEALTAPILERLAADPRFAPVPTPRWPVARAVLSFAVRGRLPVGLARALTNPRAARSRVAGLEAELRALDAEPEDAARALDEVERLLLGFPPRILPTVFPVFASALAANALAGKLLGDLATEDERRTVLRGLPHNPTTRMNLSLWALARRLRDDPEAPRTVKETPPEELARRHHDGTLPAALRAHLESFLALYGHRGVAEIDLGLPHWSEDPAYVFGVVANYLRLEEPELAPDLQFRRAEREAEAALADLTRRAARKGRLRGALVGLLLRRTRELLGMREMPKFLLILLLARARALLWTVGEGLAEAERLEEAGDIFFVSIPEAREALGGRDLRALVGERRADYEREVGRRHVPRVLLSDGTEPVASTEGETEGAADALRGTAASGGTATGEARVILDPSDARLEPGEILVAPSTDPGWTPLFLTAGGLVMEMGGAMSHGAVVAREYGIPAVVGVSGATERIRSGDRVTVDGSSGTVAVERPE